jgi:hypothetical protein
MRVLKTLTFKYFGLILPLESYQPQDETNIQRSGIGQPLRWQQKVEIWIACLTKKVGNPKRIE